MEVLDEVAFYSKILLPNLEELTACTEHCVSRPDSCPSSPCKGAVGVTSLSSPCSPDRSLIRNGVSEALKLRINQEAPGQLSQDQPGLLGSSGLGSSDPGAGAEQEMGSVGTVPDETASNGSEMTPLPVGSQASSMSSSPMASPSRPRRIRRSIFGDEAVLADFLEETLARIETRFAKPGEPLEGFVERLKELSWVPTEDWSAGRLARPCDLRDPADGCCRSLFPLRRFPTKYLQARKGAMGALRRMGLCAQVSPQDLILDVYPPTWQVLVCARPNPENLTRTLETGEPRDAFCLCRVDCVRAYRHDRLRASAHVRVCLCTGMQCHQRLDAGRRRTPNNGSDLCRLDSLPAVRAWTGIRQCAHCCIHSLSIGLVCGMHACPGDSL